MLSMPSSFLDGHPALVGDADGALLLVDDVVAAEELLALGKLDAELLLALVVDVLHFFAQHQLQE